MPCDVCPCPAAGYPACPWEAGTHRHPTDIVCNRIRGGDKSWIRETLKQADRDYPPPPAPDAPPEGALTYDDRLVLEDVAPATSIPGRPVFFTHDMRTISLNGLYRGCPAFLCGRGPSLESADLSFLREPGVLSLALNGACELLRPSMWMVNDAPDRFVQPYWDDPGVLKIVPREHREVDVAGRPVRDRPGVVYYARNARFRAAQFLDEPTFNIGCAADCDDGLGNRGGRSVMFPALKALHVLGVRRVYLLGCDFRMDPGKPYAGGDTKSPGACASNNDKFRIVDARLGVLWRQFHESGFEVMNCTPGSELTAFPAVPLDEAIMEYRSTMDRS